MAISSDEISEPALPLGFKLAQEVISREKEATLIELIDSSGLEYTPYDPGNRRASTSYGWKYDHSTDEFRPCPAIPDGFKSLRDQAARFAGIDPGSIAECLLNRYEPGAIIQWHHDKPVWEYVIGVSLGSPVTMALRKKSSSAYEYAEANLQPRSMYLLSGEARHVFQHSLPPAAETRWSITFRSLSSKARRDLEISDMQRDQA